MPKNHAPYPPEFRAEALNAANHPVTSTAHPHCHIKSSVRHGIPDFTSTNSSRNRGCAQGGRNIGLDLL